MGGKTVRNTEKQVAGFQINSATYGLTVPIILGTSRISGNVIDYYDFKAIPHVETQRTGKGGGGKIVNTTFTYTAAVLLGLAEGPSAGIGKVWMDTDKYNNLSKVGLTLFTGEHGQEAWSNTVSKHPEKALPYSGLAYVAGVMDLGSSGGVPELNFEFKGLLLDTGDGIDVNPADAIAFICSDPINGVGFGIGGIDATSLQRFRDFCTAADLLITVSLTETVKAFELINDICKATNTIDFWSQNKLKLVPMCDETLTRGGVTFTPDTVPLYDLTADDFLENGDELVSFERDNNAEAFNHVPVEFVNRANSYEKETVNGEILPDINKRGRRSASTVNMPFLHTKDRAQYVADLLVMDSLYGRNKYKFRLGWTHCLLEPGDFVTLLDPTISPNAIPVTISSIEEDEDGQLEVVAKGRQPGKSSPARYTTTEADRYMLDRNAAPGDVNPPVIFEAPKELTTANQPEIWMALSGSGEFWGGCNVWISEDGETYKEIGRVENPSRTGKLTSILPVGTSPDEVNTLAVNMAESKTSLLSGTQLDADNLNTLCYVDGEFIAYRDAALTGEGQYDLEYLIRGAYGSQIAEHAIGSQFTRIEETVFKMPYTAADIGRTFYLKFTSFNTWGFAEQGLEDVEEQTYSIAPGAPLQVEDLSAASSVKGFTISL